MAAVISRIGGLAPNLSPALKQKAAPKPAPKPAASPLASLQAQEVQGMQQDTARAAAGTSQADQLDAEARAASLAAQRQRLITVNRAQVMKFAVPILVGLSAILGRRAGMQGVLAALGGGLAGLQSGLNQNYKRAYAQYVGKQKELLAEAASYQKQAEAIRKDANATLGQKAKLLENLTSGLVSAQNARERVAGGLEKAQITGHDAILKQGMADQARMYASDSKLRQLAFMQNAAQRGGILQARANGPITAALSKQAAALLPGSAALEQKHLIEYAYTRWAIHGGPGPDLGASLAHLKTLGLVTPASVNAALGRAKATLGGMEAGDEAVANGGKAGAANPMMSVGPPLSQSVLGKLPAPAQKAIRALPNQLQSIGYAIATGREEMPSSWAIHYPQIAAALTAAMNANPNASQASFEARERALTEVTERHALAAADASRVVALGQRVRSAMQAFGPGRLPAINAADLAAQRYSGGRNAVALQQAVYGYAQALASAQSGKGTYTDAALSAQLKRLSTAYNRGQMQEALSQGDAEARLQAETTAQEMAQLRGARGYSDLGVAPPPRGYVGPRGQKVSAADVAAYAKAHKLTVQQVIQQKGLTADGQ